MSEMDGSRDAASPDKSEVRKNFFHYLGLSEPQQPRHCPIKLSNLITSISIMKGLVNILEDERQSDDYKQKSLINFNDAHGLNPACSILDFALSALRGEEGSFFDHSASLHMAFETFARLLAFTPFFNGGRIVYTYSADGGPRFQQRPLHYAELSTICFGTADKIKAFYDVLVDDMFHFNPALDPRSESGYQSLVLSALFVWSSLQQLTPILLQSVARRSVLFDENTDNVASASLVLDVATAVTNKLNTELNPKWDTQAAEPLGAGETTVESHQVSSGPAPKPTSVKFLSYLLVLKEIPTVQIMNTPMVDEEKRNLLGTLDLILINLGQSRLRNAWTPTLLWSSLLQLEYASWKVLTSLENNKIRGKG